jgi:hypothetical protein
MSAQDREAGIAYLDSEGAASDVERTRLGQIAVAADLGRKAGVRRARQAFARRVEILRAQRLGSRLPR